MERLRKTARVLDVVARIAFWFTMVVGALLFLLWALNLRDPFFTSYMGGLLMAGNLNFTLAEPVNFPWGAMLVLAALELAVYGCTVQIFRRVLRPMKEGRPFDGAARQLRRLAWVTLSGSSPARPRSTWTWGSWGRASSFCCCPSSSTTARSCSGRRMRPCKEARKCPSSCDWTGSWRTGRCPSTSSPPGWGWPTSTYPS